MSLTISQIFDIKAPQFATDAQKNDYIELAELHYDQNCYNEKYNLVVALRAAHDMTIRDLQGGAGSGSSGDVTSKREGDQAISFSSTISNMDSNSDTYLGLTRYGLEILSIKRGTIIGMGVSGKDETLNDICLPNCL